MRLNKSLISLCLIFIILTSLCTATFATVQVNEWNGNFTAYKIGDFASYNGNTYQCTIAHKSQPGWNPEVAVSLWFKLVSVTGVSSYTPNQEEQKRLDSFVLPTPSAYTIDSNGNKIDADIVSPEVLAGKDTNTDGLLRSSYDQNGYRYVFLRYDPNYYEHDPYHFFIKSVRWWNRTTQSVELKYTQSEVVSKEWSVTNNIAVDAQFKIQFLAKLDAKYGFTHVYKHTSSISNTIESKMVVRPGYEGVITKYKEGSSATGAGVYNKYRIVPGNLIWQDVYYQTASGWAVCESQDAWQNTETYKGFN